MKKLLLVFLTCLVLPSFGMNVKEMLAWKKIPKEFKSWTRIDAPQQVKYKMYKGEHTYYNSKELVGSIQLNNFYIKISDVEYQKPWTNSSGREVGEIIV